MKRFLYFVFLLVATRDADAQAVRTTFSAAGTQARADDVSTGPIAIGFNINFFGTTVSSLYVGTNGYVTFGSGQTGYTPEQLTNNPRQIIAPFYSDIDTRNPASGQITWGSGNVNGRPAFAVTWTNVGYFSSAADKRNTFQLVIINRSDRAANDFDFEFNYNSIAWEAGNFNGGVAGICSSICDAPSAGYSNGLSGANNRSYEVPGSHIRGAFLDSNSTTGLRSQQFGGSGFAGRQLYAVTNGQVTPLTITNINPPSANEGSGNLNLTINGSGFAPNATARWTRNGTTTNLQTSVTNTTTLSATVPASLLATAGTAQISVANPTGTPSAARDFTINATGPSITNISPSSALQFAGPVNVTLTGRSLATGAQLRWTMNNQATNLNATVASATSITATIPANLLLIAGQATVAVVQNGVATNALSFAVTPGTISNISLQSAVAASASAQTTATVALASPAPVDLAGTLTLSFTPNAPNLPAGFVFNEVRFASGGGTALNFTIPAGAQSATLPGNGQFSQGTVAGTIRIALSALTAAGASVLPASPPSTTVTVNRAAPVITDGSVKILNLTSSGFTLEVQGYTTTRELTSMNVTFNPAAGGFLDGPVTFPITLANAQSVWFDTAEGRSNGSRFSLRLPFTFSGNTAALGNAAVTISNTIGASAPVTGGI